MGFKDVVDQGPPNRWSCIIISSALIAPGIGFPALPTHSTSRLLSLMTISTPQSESTFGPTTTSVMVISPSRISSLVPSTSFLTAPFTSSLAFKSSAITSATSTSLQSTQATTHHTTNPSSSLSRLSLGQTVGVTVGATLLFIVTILLCLFLISRHKRPTHLRSAEHASTIGLYPGSHHSSDTVSGIPIYRARSDILKGKTQINEKDIGKTITVPDILGNGVALTGDAKEFHEWTQECREKKESNDEWLARVGMDWGPFMLGALEG